VEGFGLSKKAMEMYFLNATFPRFVKLHRKINTVLTAIRDLAAWAPETPGKDSAKQRPSSWNDQKTNFSNSRIPGKC
jgi:hypothetical protein